MPFGALPNDRSSFSTSERFELRPLMICGDTDRNSSQQRTANARKGTSLRCLTDRADVMTVCESQIWYVHSQERGQPTSPIITGSSSTMSDVCGAAGAAGAAAGADIMLAFLCEVGQSCFHQVSILCTASTLHVKALRSETNGPRDCLSDGRWASFVSCFECNYAG